MGGCLLKIDAFRGLVMFKPQAIAVLIVVFSVFFGSNGFSAESQPAFDSIAKDIQAAVKALEYPDEVGQNLVKMVQDWKCVEWKQKLSQAKQDLEAKKITADQAAQIEEEVAKELFEKIGKEIASDEEADKYFDLAKVIEEKKLNSPGFSQLFSILGNSVGLSIKVVYSFEPRNEPRPSRKRHLNCCIDLCDGKEIVVDLGCNLFSKPFVFKKEFTEDGNYWEAKDKNLLGIHSRIQIWDGNGPLAAIHKFRGEEEVNAKKYAKALAHFTKAVELNPKYANAFVGRGMTYSQQGEHAAALVDMAKAIELDPKSSEVYCCRGYAYFCAEKLTEALSDYNKSIELNPNFPMAYMQRASLYGRMGKYAEALADSTKAIELDPKSAEAYYVRGLANLYKINYPEALLDFDKAIEIDPKHSDAFSGRGCAYVGLGQFSKAFADYDKAIEISPKDPSLYYGRASVNYRLDKYKEAITDYDKAIDLKPKDADQLFGRGAAYHRMGKYAEAIADYDKAIGICPKDAKLYFNRGLSHLSLGNTKETKEDLLKAVELDPSVKKRVQEVSDRYSLNLFSVAL